MNIGTGGGSVATNTAFGASALQANTTGVTNTAVGASALAANTTAANSTAVGYQAGSSNITGDDLNAFGYQAFATSTGGANSGFGSRAGRLTTTGSRNSAFGYYSFYSNTTGGNNTAIGDSALYYNTTASSNTAVGYQAGYTNSTGTKNVYIGRQAGYVATGSNNTIVGEEAGLALSTGAGNTFVGAYNSSTGGSGEAVTTGSKNTILGSYTGNQGGLDIRTASNYIVLSDGDGNPRIWYNGATNYVYAPAIYNQTAALSASVGVDTQGALYRATSSIKYKRNVQSATHGLAEVLQLRPVTYQGKNENIDKDVVFGGLIAEEVHATGLTEFVQYAEDGSPDALAYGNMVALAFKAIQEQQALITALTTRITALEAQVGA
jgi:hypothetical protein